MNDFSLSTRPAAEACPIYAFSPGGLDALLENFEPWQAEWVRTSQFSAKAGAHILVPGKTGANAGVLFCTGDDPYLFGALPAKLPEGAYRLADGADIEDAALAWALGAYQFSEYTEPDPRPILHMPDGPELESACRIANGVYLARDLINRPANDMGPDELEAAARELADRHGASLNVIRGDELLEQNFPLIHAVGRASSRSPRLLDMVWGKEDSPKITFTGKGVCFDSGGLDLKPSSAMGLMKKDMGGAANALGLASMIMDAGIDLRLRVLIPAVENSVSGSAFRPGDVYKSRKGLSVEIGNTDAEGRLVLADALALADEEEPDLLISLATLTGAARVALGPELPPFYTHNDDLAGELAKAAGQANDPLWRMPLWPPYDKWLKSTIADLNHISSKPFAGSITAALFLARFVERAKSFAHFDIFAWNPEDRPGHPKGGEAQAILAIYEVLVRRFGS